jgi:hypothetical protein
MKYCLIEQKQRSEHYDTDFPFVYNGQCIMRSWRPNDASKIEIFNSVAAAKKYLRCGKYNFLYNGSRFDIVPYEDIALEIAELKLKTI